MKLKIIQNKNKIGKQVFIDDFNISNNTMDIEIEDMTPISITGRVSIRMVFEEIEIIKEQ